MPETISNFPHLIDTGTIYYKLVGNFIPSEWRDLKGLDGTRLSKTAKHLLSIIVYNFNLSKNAEDELQKSYLFFQDKLDVCQRRVRQCLVELEKAGYISVYLTSVVKNHIKSNNILCIKLLKNFEKNTKKVSGEPEKNFSTNTKNFQPHNIIDNIDVINEINKNNSYRGTDKQIVARYADSAENCNNNDDYGCGEVSRETDKRSDSKLKKRYSGTKLEDYYPLSNNDVRYLMQQSGRQFNKNFVNQLMLKLSEQNPENTFYHKCAVLSYMVKALGREIRQEDNVNVDGYKLKRRNAVNPLERPDLIVNKTVKQFLSAIRKTTGDDPKSILMRKIARTIEQNAAYELLISCDLTEPEGDTYPLRLLRNVKFSESVLDNLLLIVQTVYGQYISNIQMVPHSGSSQVFGSNNYT